MGLFAGTKWDVPAHCDRCGALEQECECPPLAPPPPNRTAPNKQTARLAVEKRPGGRWVTVVRGLPEAENDLPELLSRLKAGCGSGGTHKADVLELQGQQLDRVRALLEEIGYRTKG